VAIQVADRWHLLCDLRTALERLCQKLFAELQQLPISAELRAQIGWWAKFRSGRRAPAEESRKRAVYEHRRQRFEAVQQLKQAGWSIKQIARHLNVSWATARDDFERREFPPMPAPRLRRSGLDPYAAYPQTRWEAGCHNANQLWRDIREKGYSGSQRMVMLWAQVRRAPDERHAGRPRFQQPLPNEARQTLDLPAASQLAWLLVCAPEKVEPDQQPLLAHILQHPVVATAYQLAQSFTRLVRERHSEELQSWLAQCHSSAINELRQFASGLQKDYVAVLAALTLPWSSSPVEGNVTRLKLLKTQMYGRANLDLLRIRVLGET
jgi:transposase